VLIPALRSKSLHELSSGRGDARIADHYDRLPTATTRDSIAQSGQDIFKDWMPMDWPCLASSGCGRDKVDGTIDPAPASGAGYVRMARQGRTVVELLHNAAPNIEVARALATQAIEIGDGAPTIRPIDGADCLEVLSQTP
jgi:hypothetical protein